LEKVTFVVQFPEVAAQWDYSRNEKMPEDYLPFSNARVGWVCDAGHQWEDKINNRTANGRGCPYCGGSRPIHGVNDLETLYPWVAEQWDHEKNGVLNPSDVFPQSNRRVSWVCDRGHEWETKIYHRDVAAYDNRDYFWTCSNGHSWQASPANRRKGTACPYCKGKLPVVGINDFGTICPAVAAQWHPSKNGDSLPQHFLPNSHENVWWKCEDGHEWKASIESRTRGARCPICSNRQVRHRYLI
jgi:hypothetical protein